MIKKIRIYYLILFLFCLVFNKAGSTNYYFSTSTGNDSQTSVQAQNMLTPWKTLTKLNSYMSSLLPGDSVLFKRGEVFYGSITITKSGTAALPITFAAYGTGAKPQISGLSTLSSWVSKGTNLWEADCALGGTTVNNLLINNVPQQIGRYPNITNPNKGYLNFESHVSNTQITDNQLTASPNWTGAEVVVRTNHWVIEKLPIKLHSGSTITYTGVTDYTPADNWGYFIQNSPLTLDQFGEWYYNPSTKKMLIYTNSTNPSSSVIEIPTVGTLVTMNSSKFVNIKNIVFNGSNLQAISISSAQSINITNCDIKSSGVNGIVANNSSYISFENNTITNTKNNALYFSSKCNFSSIRNNTITNTGLIPGSGATGDDTYQAVIIRGTDNLIEYNKIDSTGYIPIRFDGESAIVKNNLITNYLSTKDDGGGIYSWKGCAQTVATKLSKVIDNIMINGVGAPEGTNYNYSAVHGIYMDDNVSNVEISGNTISNIKDGGIFLHNAHEITMTNNTSFNNGKQLFIQYNNCVAGLIRNIVFNNNILFSKTSAQLIIDIYNTNNDVSSFGTFDNNFYCRPANENSIIRVKSVDYNLTNWQTTFDFDPLSNITPLALTNLESNLRFEYNGTQSAKVISLDATYVDVKNKSYSGSLTLQPFSSIILLKKSVTTDVNTTVAPKYDVSVYPNPAHDFFMLQFVTPTQENIHMELFDLKGQSIRKEDLPLETSSKQINIESLPTGIYMLALRGKNITTTRKVVVSR